MNNFYNFLLILVFIGIGVYFIYSTYKRPAQLYSTDLKGYIAGILFLTLGILSLIGKFNILKDLLNK